MDKLHEKYKNLLDYLGSLGKVAIAYSSGVDSTFLLKAAVAALGEKNVLAMTASSCFFPLREKTEAIDFTEELGVKHIVVDEDILAVDDIASNPPNRCYLCKKALFSELIRQAREEGFASVCEGSNMDDLSDYRPGMQAILELGVLSPLRTAALYKEDIRELSREMKLKTSEKPAFACLASRFVYGEQLTEEKLGIVDRAEQFLLDKGFSQFRVRLHGDKKNLLARIEVLPEDISTLSSEDMRLKVHEYFKSLGIVYISMDLKGYAQGNMNKGIEK